jgi:TetR/AcrR family transcriptional repressor of nem operon
MWEDARVASTRAAHPGDTATRILDVGDRLVQTRGYNGFSYADVAGELSITTASLHYHYRAKRILGQALVDRYATRFLAALEAISTGGLAPPAELRAYVSLYRGVLEQGRMCLCGMLAAEQQTLPQGMRTSLAGFFDENEAWLAGVVERGRAQHAIRDDGTPSREVARTVLGALEGGMLVAHGTGEIDRFDSAANGLLALLLA